MERFLIDDQGRIKKRLKPLDISPTLRREMHGNEPRVVEPVGWELAEELDETKTKGDGYMEEIKANFNYVSLFSGIGGFEQALNKLGGTCVLASEIDKFANQAYEVLYGHSTVGDITKVEAEEVPDHDVLVGGFPCQAFSVAGKRGGFEDARGTLFFEMARIAKEKQPKIFLAENVKGLLSHDKGRTMDTIVTTLSDIGYRVDFEVLNSKYFGVPQNRERVFLIGIREDLLENEAWDIPKGQTVVPKAKRRLAEYEDLKTFNFEWPAQEDVLTRLKDVLEAEVDEKYYLSEDKTAKLVAQLPDSESDSIVQIGNIDQHKRKRNNPQTGRVYATSGVGPTLSTMQGGGLEPKIAEIQYPLKATCLECRVTYYVDCGCSCASYVGEDGSIVSQTEVLPVLTPDRMEKRQNGRRFKEDGEESFTLTAQDRHGVAIREVTKKGYAIAEEGDSVNVQFPGSKTRRGQVGKQIANTLEASSINQGVVESPPKYRIRKLTPLECFRLQGFPDEAHEAVKEAGISDSQRYKMAGNAVTVNVIDAIGRSLTKYLT